ncbi:hypothetical protein G6011_03500 [Alternaria panax]|uniref:Uncharacterized protein n=1 Tax=Alternaria panax TaxID=48097 RepID=A0AAD4NU37_9PLEO|nr:hypothetical protein G6011_03500 [Alternaria panax]
MSSAYILIEQPELHSFLHDLEALHFWARNMAGLGTSITALAPLAKPAIRSDRNPYARPVPLNPFTSSPTTTYPAESSIFPPSPRSRPSRRDGKPKILFCDMGQGKQEFELFPGENRPPSFGMPDRSGGMQSGVTARQGCKSRGFPQNGRRVSWKAPVQRGPHRTPNITRAPDVAHTPQRGVRFVRRPRRVRPEWDATDAAMEEETEDTEDEEYVVEEDDNADLDEGKAC